MNVKERIISLRLVERNEKNDAFFEQIGVTATVKVNDTNPETHRNKGSMKAFGV